MGQRLIMYDKIVFASKNKGKIREVKQLFSTIGVEVLSINGDFDPVEDGETFLDNAIIKAKEAVKITGKVSLADDSGLMVDALKGAPGVHSARYADTDEARINKLLKALENVEEGQRQARFVCSMALVSPECELLHSTSGACEGQIIYKPEGSDGFGYDPIFFLSDLNLTMAQIPLEKKNTISHRSRALRQMLEWLKKN